jgi:hypothetical protein
MSHQFVKNGREPVEMDPEDVRYRGSRTLLPYVAPSVAIKARHLG